MRHAVPEWTEYAACLNMDVDTFFPELSSNHRTGSLYPVELAPKAVCFDCPVRERCLEFMYSNEEAQGVQDGVWGGTLLRERRAVAHTPPCTGNAPFPCRGCRPIPERINLLMGFVEQQAMFLADRCDLDAHLQLALEM